MEYRLMVFFLFFLWITESTCDCGLTFPLGIECMARYSNRSKLCQEGNSHNPNVTSNSTLITYLNISNTYLGDYGYLHATIEENEPSVNVSYNFLFCVIRNFTVFSIPFTIPVNSCYLNDTLPVMNTTVLWQSVASVSVFVFSSINNGTSTGCDYQELKIKNCSHSLDVNLRLSQSHKEEEQEEQDSNIFHKINRKPDNINHQFFEIGNVTVHVNVTPNATSHSSSEIDNECNSTIPINTYTIDTGSGSTISNGSSSTNDSSGGTSKEQPTYQYTFYFPGGIRNRTRRNETRAKFDHYFDEAIDSWIFVEVVSWTSTDVRYGKQTIKLDVYEPVSNSQVSTSGKLYSGQNIQFTVQAEGSTPIEVEWTLFHDTRPVYCEMNGTKLNDTTSETFNCLFNDIGDYHFNATFKNMVGHEYADKSFTITQPPPINVVATSTSAVAVLIVVIILVIITIVLVSTYISYRKFRNKSTETADFSFVNLNRPSRWQRLSSSASQLKDRFSKKGNKRFGLVNTSESLDSFYGSLNPFAAHETL